MDVLAVLLGTPVGMCMVWWVFRAVFRRLRPSAWLGLGLGLPTLIMGMVPVIVFSAWFGVLEETTELGRLSFWACIGTMVATYRKAKANVQSQ